MQRNNLNQLVNSNGYAYNIKIVKGVYGLKQAAALAHPVLVKLLLEVNYYPIKNTSGLWKHKSHKTV